MIPTRHDTTPGTRSSTPADSRQAVRNTQPNTRVNLCHYDTLCCTSIFICTTPIYPTHTHTRRMISKYTGEVQVAIIYSSNPDPLRYTYSPPLQNSKTKTAHGHRPGCCIEAGGRRDTWACWVNNGVPTSVTRRTAMGVRGGAVVSDQYNARMQVMITRNMRKVCMYIQSKEEIKQAKPG